jgi:hypothetical protein
MSHWYHAELRKRQQAPQAKGGPYTVDELVAEGRAAYRRQQQRNKPLPAAAGARASANTTAPADVLPYAPAGGGVLSTHERTPAVTNQNTPISEKVNQAIAQAESEWDAGTADRGVYPVRANYVALRSAQLIGLRTSVDGSTSVIDKQTTVTYTAADRARLAGYRAEYSRLDPLQQRRITESDYVRAKDIEFQNAVTADSVADELEPFRQRAAAIWASRGSRPYVMVGTAQCKSESNVLDCLLAHRR